MNSEDIDIVILCGGLGNRLRPIIHDRPKALAKIGNRIFLDILIDYIVSNGYKNTILCIGYLKDQIKGHYKCCKDIRFSEEEEPLGTGGALYNAGPLIKSDPFIVMNGDSICDMNLKEFVDFHKENKCILSVALSKYDDIKDSMTDYGIVNIDSNNKITNFNEKHSTYKLITNQPKQISNKNGELLINAGIYIMQKEIFGYMPNIKNFSLEYDFFPKIIKENECYGYTTDKYVIDIGTPKRYKKAIEIFKNIEMIN